MFNIEATEVEAYCLGTKSVPDRVANDPAEFADWSSVASRTDVKKELARKYLNQPVKE